MGHSAGQPPEYHSGAVKNPTGPQNPQKYSENVLNRECEIVNNQSHMVSAWVWSRQVRRLSSRHYSGHLTSYFAAQRLLPVRGGFHSCFSLPGGPREARLGGQVVNGGRP